MSEAETPIEEAVPTPDIAPGRRLRRWWLALLVAAAAAVASAVLWPQPEPAPPVLAARAFDDFTAGRLPLGVTSADADAIAAYLEPRVTFPVRVFDLDGGRFAPVGGRVHSLNGRAAALWASRGKGGSVIVLLYRGRTTLLPRAVETRAAGGFDFLVYHEQGGTQVFWQQGDVVCALASGESRDDLVRLAAAHATRSPGP